MIRQIVFDFGQVLVHFVPREIIMGDVTDEQDIALLEEVAFDRLYWDKLDAGTITNEAFLGEVKTRLPERLWDTAQNVYYDWIHRLREIDGMRALVAELKAAGMPLYLLSNISHYFADHEQEIPVLALFDRRFYSARLGMVKPSAEIFEHVCRECDCAPQETLFIDDSEKNIAGAQAVGYQTYLFDGDATALRAWLVEKGVL